MSNSKKPSNYNRKNSMYLPMFPEPSSNNDISTEDFLAAAHRFLKTLDVFGKIFMPVKYDMQGNIDKLNKIFKTDKGNYSTLQKILIDGKDPVESSIASDALLWLTRGLHMIQIFFQLIVQDFEAGHNYEDLVPCLNMSYRLTLEPHHGFIAQHLFRILSRKMPKRKQILKAMACGIECKDEVIIRNMDRFSKRLKTNVTVIKKFYDDNNLEPNDRV